MIKNKTSSFRKLWCLAPMLLNIVKAPQKFLMRIQYAKLRLHGSLVYHCQQNGILKLKCIICSIENKKRNAVHVGCHWQELTEGSYKERESYVMG